jgi:mRNA interferase HigB
MKIISRSTIKSFTLCYADATDALVDWFLKTRHAHWDSPAKMREIFNSVRYVGNDLYIFNIRGNRYRLIARIFFKPVAVVYIRFIGTHAQYDTLDLNSL